ncbi:3-deoxy-D-manno-octulosonic acid transferase [Paucibacter sp. APW11]|uniref:3-deoxy-D-manno-octulosonic acid transferase n=1 Tax=Roseateles aquae TaxID=3077235 RepID=A0ABU3P888_9BURK|nr:3-deoxy-D-manno-octulosonic acid transferase [Paucibacter sp. APW11]MDT8998759.1 3-deoxy-D-manno-octulosonic acid transferase [Paucibacter sp. APW11]
MRAGGAETLKQRLARWAYGWALRLATPLYLLKLWRRGAAEPLYRQDWGQRFGFGPAAVPASAGGALWLHAVSLGETRAAAPLIEALRAAQPGLRLLLTHATATGREAGQALLHDGDQQCWLPYDSPGAVRRFLCRHRPAVGVLMETEIWPTLLYEAQRQGLPMVLANARLSEKSARKGRRLQALLGAAAARLTLALAQTEADATRLRDAGVHRVRVMGNLKYDLHPDPRLLAQGQGWQMRLQQQERRVLLAAVTREGEEAELLDQFLQWPAPRPLLLIVPRHPQRFDEVAALVSARGLRLARRSSWGAEPDAAALAAEVWLGDSMREMPLYYAAADLALLGGSFAPLGGQNLIEAAACGCPLLMGPHTFNFADAAALAAAAGAAERADDLAGALQRAQVLLADPAGLQQRAEQARRFAACHRGAAAAMAAEILALLRR